MSDVNCPYCNESQEINHDDGYGYEEDREHEQDCFNCGKTFKFNTSISFSYEVFCNGDHKLNEDPIKGYSYHAQCENCDYYEIRV